MSTIAESVRRSHRRSTKIVAMCAVAMAALLIPIASAEASVSVTYYELRAQHSDKCAHVVDASQADGALTQQRWCYQARHQYWRLVPSTYESGYYTLRAWHSDKCLGVRGGSYDDGALIHQWTCNGARSQQWKREWISGGWYRLRALHSDKCLDVRFGSFSDWTPLQQWQCSAATQQLWRFV